MLESNTHSSLFGPLIKYNRKTFYNIDTWKGTTVPVTKKKSSLKIFLKYKIAYHCFSINSFQLRLLRLNQNMYQPHSQMLTKVQQLGVRLLTGGNLRFILVEFLTLNLAVLLTTCTSGKQPLLELKTRPGLKFVYVETGNTKGGSITVPLTSCLTGLD
jgi:hypothetical protein